MNLSYWERKSWFSNIDFTIIGSGIVGLNCALALKNRYPKARILVLEKGSLPQGASTKNAGFACFGSISEILSDLKNHTEQEVQELVFNRWQGIQLLRSLLGDTALGFQNYGGHELFLEDRDDLFQTCKEQIKRVNELLHPVFQDSAFKITSNLFNFGGVKDHYITHAHEGQIDTGGMMKSLVHLVLKKNITIINSVTVRSFEDLGTNVLVRTSDIEFNTKKLIIATNGFAKQLIQEEVQPARAQIVLTKPIPGLTIKGTFHLDEGFYYFRNIENRILLGGGRNLDFKAEETTNFGMTNLVERKLIHLLKTVILPNTSVEIDMKWSGIMGVGAQKKPIVKKMTDNVACGVRLGGMGIAIGTSIGHQLADLFK
ncbi:NAD(P)/FAD-dependent oxidoreductase [Maribacter sp. MAR_2009_72]|uniref:NAD(P)/FAD-dependent oxidoreductase n=1 Tax=Maribacter sp. MAR_2009_72 TaxID=1250050 RepID=UPI00119971B4|nr:FAD-dependent oxidoreductase [Maribacter sp. MAR_2009_72]TVZ16030.1 glycine/D-amino acid oxidase-like deaminating enzyme [Maribacter sp. MAR_2009_72]